MTADAAAAPPAPSTARKLAAEALGTFVLVLFGCASVVYYTNRDEPDVVPIALTFGLTLAVLSYALGRISGAHLNPAVSLAAALAGRMPWLQALLYAAVQVLGAVLAGAVLLALMHGFDGYEVDQLGLGQNSFGDEGSGYAWWAAFLLELLLTAILVTVVLAVSDARNEHPALAPLAIGSTLAAIHFVAVPATLASVNPARSIGPALYSGVDPIIQLWLFVLAPLLGAALAGAAYPLLFGRGAEPVAGSGLRLRRPRPAAAAGAAVPGYGAPDSYQQQWNQQVWAGEPIIQDGWQWDPTAQQWVPAQQAAPVQHTPTPHATDPAQRSGGAHLAPGQQAAPSQHTPGQHTPGQHTGQPTGQHAGQGDPFAPPAAQDQWPDDGPTQIRPGR